MVAIPTLVIAAAFHYDLGHRAFGYAEGKYETLEDDLDAQWTVLTALLDEALGPYEELGSSVDLFFCEPLNEWSPSTTIVADPGRRSPANAVHAIVVVLEDLWLEPELSGYASVYEVDLPGFGEPLRFRSSNQPQPAIAVTLGGGCYPESRIAADSPYSLEYEQGLSRLPWDS